MKPLKAGDRVELVSTTDPYTNMAPGTRGVMVTDAPEPSGGVPITGPLGDIDTYTILSVKWDSGSWLHMIPEAGDVIVAVDNEITCPTCGNADDNKSVDFNENQAGGWWRCGVDSTHKFQHRVVVLK